MKIWKKSSNGWKKTHDPHHAGGCPVAVNRDDIARLAGVSSATVSRVFNSPDRVADATVRKVRSAAKKAGYRPNKFASALRRKSSGTIVFLENEPMSRSGPDRSYMWFYADVIQAVKRVIDTSMYTLMLQSYTGQENIQALIREAPAGVIIHQVAETRIMRSLNNAGIPAIGCYRKKFRDYNYAIVDEVHGGMIAGRHLAETGHRKPVHISGCLTTCEPCALRWKGFQQAFPDKPYLIEGKLGFQGGLASGYCLAEHVRKGKADSAMVVNDLTAVGVLQALQQKHIRVPEDISIIGYDNLPFTETLPVRLSTVALSLDRVYTTATERLLSAIQQPAPIRESVEPVLVPGDSVIPRTGNTS